MKKVTTYLTLFVLTAALSGCAHPFFCGMTFGQDDRACAGIEDNPFR